MVCVDGSPFNDTFVNVKNYKRLQLYCDPCVLQCTLVPEAIKRAREERRRRAKEGERTRGREEIASGVIRWESHFHAKL